MSVSTLGYALLGLLAREPLSGYAIARQMRAPIGYFWYARHSQIYPELARLLHAGLVSFETVEQRDRPDKKVYSLTPAGRAALEAWATAPVEPQPVRDELVLKAFSAWLVEPAAAARVFRERERQHREQLAFYEQCALDIERGWGQAATHPDRPEWATRATLERGLRHERESAEWCAWVAAQLEASASRGAASVPAATSR